MDNRRYWCGTAGMLGTSRVAIHGAHQARCLGLPPGEYMYTVNVMWDFHIEGAVSSRQPSTTHVPAWRLPRSGDWVDLKQ